MGKFFLLKILNNEVKIMLSLEKEIFKSFIPDFEKLIEYGFLYKNEKYYFEKTFLNGNFKVVIEISNQNKINSMVYDVENNEEYINLINNDDIDVGIKRYFDIHAAGSPVEKSSHILFHAP